MWGRGDGVSTTPWGLGQEEVIETRGLPPPRRRPGGPGLGRWPAMSMTGKSPDGCWREPRSQAGKELAAQGRRDECVGSIDW